MENINNNKKADVCNEAVIIKWDRIFRGQNVRLKKIHSKWEPYKKGMNSES